MKNKWYRFMAVFLICMTVAGLSACSGGAGPGTSDGPGHGSPSPTFPNGLDVQQNKKYQDVFNGQEIREVSVTLSEAYWNEILAAPENEQFYSADITFDGIEIENVGFRTMGNTDLSDARPEASARYSFKVKFDKYVDKQKWEGLDEMVLTNLAKDPSYMREYLTYEAFRYIGGYAPLATYVKLHVNGEYKGLYLCLEAVDDSFLKRVFGNNNGNLYKADQGTALKDEQSLPLLDQKNGADESKTDLAELIRVLNHMPPGEKGAIERVLDVDSALKYIAVNTALGCYNGYLGKNAENFYLCGNNGVFSMIPWDYNRAFGGNAKDQGASMTLSPLTPIFNISDISDRPLVNNLLAVEEYRTTYESYIKKLTSFLEEIPGRVEALHAQIGSAVETDLSAFYPYTSYCVNIGISKEADSAGIISLTAYAEGRAAFLRSLGY